MLTKEQYEIALKCDEMSDCHSCPMYSLADGKGCVEFLAKTGLELLDKLERAKMKMKELEICSTCINFKTASNGPCKRCQNLKTGDLWVFNEKLLEVQE